MQRVAWSFVIVVKNLLRTRDWLFFYIKSEMHIVSLPNNVHNEVILNFVFFFSNKDMTEKILLDLCSFDIIKIVSKVLKITTKTTKSVDFFSDELTTEVENKKIGLLRTPCKKRRISAESDDVKLIFAIIKLE